MRLALRRQAVRWRRFGAWVAHRLRRRRLLAVLRGWRDVRRDAAARCAQQRSELLQVVVEDLIVRVEGAKLQVG
jgi:hypothetical protein